MPDKCQTEDEAVRTRRFLDTIVEAVPALIAVKDSQQRFLLINRTGAEILGMPREEILDKTDYDLFPKEDADGFRLRDQAVMASGTLEIIEEEYVPTETGTRVLRCKKIAIVDPNGSPCLLTIGEDVTASIETARALSEALDAAQAANRSKSEFLANMSHEIRTPMNGILGMTGLLLDTILTDEQRKFVGMVQESGEALLSIINDILDISKLEAGKVEIENVEFDLVETVEGVVTFLSPKALEKNIELGVYLDPQARAAFRGDQNRIRQVLLNLVGNGIKFTEQGGVSVQVGPGAGPKSGGTASIRFEVKDTGIGMSEDVRVNLFQKFTQADSSITRRFGGTGLGLAICKQLVELMGGKIDVTSQPGAGSAFSFEIPLGPAGALRTEYDFHVGRLAGLRALVVDDIEMNLEILSRQLRSLGMEPNCSKDGFDAQAELERAWRKGNPYDIVFIDQMMPGLSGEDLATRVRAIPSFPETKLILVSSAGLHARGPAAMKSLDAILDKPLRQRDLLACLARLYRDQPPAPVEKIAPAKVTPGKTIGIAKSSHALNILLAEDNRINQIFVTTLLQKAGHHVDIAGNGNQAVEMVRQRDYDVVLMDIQMPELDGIQATLQIRALPDAKGEVPIIALTANAMTGDRQEYLDAGMNDYISKPIQSGTLLARLEAILPRPAEQACA